MQYLHTFFLSFFFVHYFHHVWAISSKTLISTLGFFVFVILVSDVVTLPPIAIEGVHWARDGPKFACKVDGYDASYMVKYNLVQHLQVCHNVLWNWANPNAHLLERKA